MRKTIFYILPIILITSFLLSSCDGILSFDKAERTTDGTTIIETGELAAINSVSFVIPRFGRRWGEMKIIGLLNHGSIVNKGDSVVQLDPADINKYILDRESSLETQLAALEKLYIEQENKRQENESRIRSELASFDLKKIE